MSIGFAVYLIVLALMLTLGYGAWSAAPWVPSRKADRELLASAVPLRPGALVHDLGCGDGTLLFAIADRHPGIRGIGWDVALPPLFLGWIRRRLAHGRYDRIEMRWGNLFRQSVADADAVFIYLMPRAQSRVLAKLAREVRDDAYVVCEAWPLPGVTPERKLGAPGAMPAYVYRGAALRQPTANQKTPV